MVLVPQAENPLTVKVCWRVQSSSVKLYLFCQDAYCTVDALSLNC